MMRWVVSWSIRFRRPTSLVRNGLLLRIPLCAVLTDTKGIRRVGAPLRSGPTHG
mgnify:CR=1 FL=1